MSGDPKERTKAILQWRPNWKDRPWILFEREAVLHSDKFLWKSFEDENAARSLSEWKEWTSNPGKTKREERMYRAFMTRMMKRNWTKEAEEAKCVVWGG